MSSPPSGPGAPSSQPMSKASSQKTIPRPPTSSTHPGPSTPGASATANGPTPKSQHTPASHLSPSHSRLGGKFPSKTPAVSTPTPGRSSAHATESIGSPALIGLDSTAMSHGLSMSGLGLNMSLPGASSMGALDDEQRKRRLEAVLATLGTKPGAITQAGVKRLAHRWGLELYEEPGDQKLVTLGGGKYAVDIFFQSNDSPIVKNVALHFFGVTDSVAEHTEPAAKVLHNDLKIPKAKDTLTAKLDRFADNLERLQRLDKLSVQGANCFEAVSGVYTSLKRLYDHERAMEAVVNKNQDRIERNVTCLHSGRPRMHVRQRIGLSLGYWMDERLVWPKMPPRAEQDSMELDAPEEPNKDKDPEEEEEDNEIGSQHYSLTIECEHCPPALYPSLRVTSDWLSLKPPPKDETQDTNSEQRDNGQNEVPRTQPEWQDPPPAASADTENSDMMATDSLPAPQAPPDRIQARFIARLERSLSLPTAAAAEVYAVVHPGVSHEAILHDLQMSSSTTYDSLIFDTVKMGHTAPRGPAANGEVASSFRYRSIQTPSTSLGKSPGWQTRLFISRSESGRQIDSIPFEHPRQIIAVLPILRQYALFARILRNSFVFASSDGEKNPKEAQANGHHEGANHPALPRRRPPRCIKPVRNPNDALAVLLSDNSTANGPHKSIRHQDFSRPILDVSLTQIFPIPRLSIAIRGAGPTASVKTFRVEVLSGGILRVEGSAAEESAADNGAGDGDMRTSDARGPSDEILAEGLAICEDLGVWAEWMSVRRWLK